MKQYAESLESTYEVVPMPPLQSAIRETSVDTKEKPFQCSQCPKAFTRKDLLSRHDRLSHHSGTASQSSSSTALPVAYSSQQPPISINVLLDPTTEHSSRQPDVNQESTLQRANDVLGASLNEAESLPTTTGIAKSYEGHVAQVFDIPPLMWAKEINFELPCREKEWRARNEEEWKQAYDHGGQPAQNFRETFASLFASTNETDDKSKTNQTSFSSLGGCVLMHALIQQIWLARNSGLPLQQPENSLSTEQIGAFENALRTWAIYWEQNQESSMDPLSPHGPIAFTSTALMRLAYIRLNMNLGPIRCLSSWDPHLIAQSLHASPQSSVARDSLGPLFIVHRL
ncbi:hypothetical protein TrVFT333_009470 [Trichoderma virens FT-333]|nr:hypothetical protein TrVFT333_009470 [Trichoderma virens FT-333]